MEIFVLSALFVFVLVVLGKFIAQQHEIGALKGALAEEAQIRREAEEALVNCYRDYLSAEGRSDYWQEEASTIPVREWAAATAVVRGYTPIIVNKTIFGWISIAQFEVSLDGTAQSHRLYQVGQNRAGEWGLIPTVCTIEFPVEWVFDGGIIFQVTGMGIPMAMQVSTQARMGGVGENGVWHDAEVWLGVGHDAPRREVVNEEVNNE